MVENDDIIGTWFPSGYFGHFRSKTRNDVLQEYRHAASPNPPDKFKKRVRVCPDRHLFSKHDNKHSFPTDASYFDTGLGRRKSGRSSTIFKPDFIAWIPHQEELKKEGAAVSLYRLDFRAASTEPVPQRLSPRICRKIATQSQVDDRMKWVSDVRNYLQHGQPNPTIDTDYNTGKVFDGIGQNPRTHHELNATGRNRKVIPHYLAHTVSARRRTKSAPITRMNVADCLVWPQEPLNQSITINNIYDKSSMTYKLKNPFAPKTPRKFRDVKPQYVTLPKPPSYHTRVAPQKPDTPRPPSAARKPSQVEYVRVPPPITESSDINPDYDITQNPTMTSSTPRETKSMTPAATAVNTFYPGVWRTQQNPIPTVVVN